MKQRYRAECAHLRIVPPADYVKGKLSLNAPTDVLITLPGESEVHFPGTIDIEVHWGQPGNPTSVTLTFNATVQIEEGRTPLESREREERGEGIA